MLLNCDLSYIMLQIIFTQFISYTCTTISLLLAVHIAHWYLREPSATGINIDIYTTDSLEALNKLFCLIFYTNLILSVI